MQAHLSEITAIVRELVHDDSIELTEQTQFSDVIGWDSMDLIAAVVEVECRLGMTFEVPEIQDLETVGDLIRLIEHKQPLVSA